MADRWNEDREHEARRLGRRSDRDFDYAADAYEGREDRSFMPRYGGNGDRRPVFGERETGLSYSGPSYGPGGYSDYGVRVQGRRDYGERNYATGSDRDYGYGADVYQERSAGGPYPGGESRSRAYRAYGDREADYGPHGYDRAFRADREQHSGFGFGYDLGGPEHARGRQEFDRDFGDRDRGRGLGARVSRFFGRGEDWRGESHRGRGPKGYKRSDSRISEDVHDQLTEDPYVDASSISVRVRDGEVTLDGTVTSRHAKHHTEHIIEDISGVKHVQNNLRVEERETPRGATTAPSTPLGENSKLVDQAAGKA
ncbi:MAG TPA: BON domain-containing protein [Phenylobacterium sp.]|nr:BON domain-containing protein [Phenylobacterium sp.]